MAFATAEEYKNMAGNFIHDIIDEDIKNQKYHLDEHVNQK